MNLELGGWVRVSDLTSRYDRRKSVIYKRMSSLCILPHKVGVRAYVDLEQLTLLDALHEFIQGGGTTAEFLFFRGLDADERR
jgi:hypothetical protein